MNLKNLFLIIYLSGDKINRTSLSGRYYGQENGESLGQIRGPT